MSPKLIIIGIIALVGVGSFAQLGQSMSASIVGQSDASAAPYPGPSNRLGSSALAAAISNVLRAGTAALSSPTSTRAAETLQRVMMLPVQRFPRRRSFASLDRARDRIAAGLSQKGQVVTAWSVTNSNRRQIEHAAEQLATLSEDLKFPSVNQEPGTITIIELAARFSQRSVAGEITNIVLDSRADPRSWIQFLSSDPASEKGWDSFQRDVIRQRSEIAPHRQWEEAVIRAARTSDQDLAAVLRSEPTHSARPGESLFALTDMPYDRVGVRKGKDGRVDGIDFYRDDALETSVGLALSGIQSEYRTVREGRMVVEGIVFENRSGVIERRPKNPPLQSQAVVRFDADRVFDSLATRLGGMEPVRLGIVDNGFDYNHPMLRGQVLPFQVEGKKELSHHWDFMGDDRRPFEEETALFTGTEIPGHGTHVAGIAIRGAPHAELALVRYGSSESVVEGARRLARDGARVINLSLVLDTAVKSRFEAMTREFPHVLFVMGAGNDTKKLDHTIPIVRAPNVLIVGAHDRTGTLSSFSNFHETDVDMLALGSQVKSTMPGSNFAVMDGTSMAAPMVSNTAVKVLGIAPDLSVSQLREILMRSTVRSDKLAGKSASGGRLDKNLAMRVAYLLREADGSFETLPDLAATLGVRVREQKRAMRVAREVLLADTRSDPSSVVR